MSLSFLYWLFYLLAVVFGLWGYWPAGPGAPAWRPLSGPVLLYVLLFLLGWRVFGFVITG